MSKKYGIGFLVGMILFTLVLVCAYEYTYDRANQKREIEKMTREQQKEPVLQTEGNATKQNGYYISEADGYVIVYYADKKTVYEYTSILVEFLPKSVQQEIKAGIELTDIKEVYGFLENYSS